MKIIVIGASGTLGRAVVTALEPGHEVVRASRHGPVPVDLEDPASIDALFDTAGGADAVVCCAASGQLAPLTGTSDEEFTLGLRGKLLGQVHLTRRAAVHLTDGGSVTLTSGRFAEPVPGSSWGFLVNAGLEAFIHAAAVEMPRGIRLNVVSPGWIAETLEALGEDPGSGTLAAEVARSYLGAVEGAAHGQVL